MKSLSAAIVGTIALTFASLSPVPIASAEDATWNQWRGHRRDGSWPGKLPTSLATLEVAWEKPMQPSYSGPITDGSHIYSTETVDETYERITSHDIETGKLAWSAQWNGAIKVPPYAMANGSWIKSTPALFGKH